MSKIACPLARELTLQSFSSQSGLAAIWRSKRELSSRIQHERGRG